MTIKPLIIHLTEVILSNKDKSEKKIIAKLLSVLECIEEMNIPSSQEEEIIRFIKSLNLKTYRGGNKKVIKRKLNQLNDYLRTEHSLIPEGYYMSLGMGLGPGLGLALGVSMATAFGFNIPIVLTYGVAIGMVAGMFVGIYMDDTAKKKGKVISILNN